MKLKDTVFSAIFGMAAGMAVQRRKNSQIQMKWKDYGDKYYEYFQLLNRWMIGRNEGKRVADFFEEEGIRRIAVYGMGDLANRLAEELSGSNVTIVYGIDRDVCCTNSQIEDVRSPEDVLPAVDAVVITPFLSAAQIGKNLEKKCSYRLIPLDDIIYSL